MAVVSQSGDRTLARAGRRGRDHRTRGGPPAAPRLIVAGAQQRRFPGILLDTGTN